MTWVLKHTPRGPMRAEYECPVHGRFEAIVERNANGDPPATAPCPVTAELEHYCEEPPCSDCGFTLWTCLEVGAWRISAPAVHTQFVIGAVQGKPDAKPHANAMDTRPLAEGRKNEWRKGRKKLREERRHQRMKEYLR